jgi:fibronectin type 3 domain-containing protein
MCIRDRSQSSIEIGDPKRGTNPVRVKPSTPIAIDSTDSSSQVQYIQYRLNNGGWQTYAGQFTIVNPGAYVLGYRAIDNAGNIELEKTTNLFVELISDNEAPALVGVDPANNALRNNSSQVITVVLDDGLGSGVNSSASNITLSLDGVSIHGTISSPASNTIRFTPLAPLNDGHYVLTIAAIDNDGNSTTYNSGFDIDSTPPQSPVSLSASPAEVAIDLSWSPAAQSDAASFNVYRGTASGIYSLLAQGLTLPGYRDAGVSAGTFYYYVVTAKDVVGNESVYSNESSATPLSDTSSPVVTAFTPADGTHVKGSVQLSASATDNKAVTAIVFEVYGGGANGVWTELARIPVSTGESAFAYYELDVSSFAEGQVLVRAYAEDAAGNKGTPIQRSLIVDNTAPVVPVLTGQALESRCELSWISSASPDVDHYLVFRSTQQGSGYVQINSSLTETYFVDTNVIPNTRYYYVLRAVDKVGNISTASNEISLLPTDDITAPQVISFDPPETGSIYDGVNLHATAIDNRGVTGYKFELSTDGTVWQLLGASANGNLVWHSETVDDGAYYIRVTASDAAGNTANRTNSYVIDNSPPNAPENIAIDAEQWSLTVYWTPVSRSDFDHYTVYRSTDGGPFEVVVQKTTSTIFVDSLLSPAHTFSYMVTLSLIHISEPTRPY